MKFNRTKYGTSFFSTFFYLFFDTLLVGENFTVAWNLVQRERELMKQKRCRTA